MSEKGEGMSRRDFLKVLGLVGGTAVAWKAVDKIADSREDLSNPDNLKEFLGGEFQPAYFKGKVHVREKATIHSEPTYWNPEDDRSLITTQKNPNTRIATVDVGDDFVVNNPLLVFQEAREGEGGVYIKEVIGPGGVKKTVDTRGSWIVFGTGLTQDLPGDIKKDISRTRYNVGCINFQDVAFEPVGDRIQFMFPQEAVEFKNEIELGL